MLLSVATGVVALLAAQTVSGAQINLSARDKVQNAFPLGTGQGDWAGAYGRAKQLVDKMTLEEKISLTAGINAQSGCSGVINAIPRLNFPGMCLSDAGNGLRGTDAVSGFAAGISVGASWNKDLAAKRGAAMGGEFRRKGVNVLLGPVCGPAWTVVKGGRNWEGTSADPYLSGQLIAETVKGVQSSNVITSTKHYIANEQELNRVPSGNKLAISSNVDDQTMHEVYLWPFQDAVKAGSANIMCSYNRINQTYACGNDKSLNGLLKTELGFQGFVVSDWGALHATNDAPAGLDMAMPGPDAFFGKTLLASVKNGTIPEARITDMVTRIIASWYKLDQDVHFPNPGVGMPIDRAGNHTVVEGRDPADLPTILEGAVEGHVLVKNDKNTLPFKSPKAISIFGYSGVRPPQWTAQTDFAGSWLVGLAPINIAEIETALIGPRGTLSGGGGSGAITPATFHPPQDAFAARAKKDGFTLYQDLTSAKPTVHPDSDACVVLANAWAREGEDRLALKDAYTDTLINTVANQCAKTVVVFHNAGPRVVDDIVNHPNVTAIVFAHLPGQDTGPALVSLLWGDVNPSGKLPYTVAKKEADYGSLLNPVPDGGSNDPQSDFAAGIYLDYKYFEKSHIEPQYEFGFGLSYTRWDYSAIQLQGPIGAAAEWPTGETISGGQEDLWEPIAKVSFTLGNGGHMAGAEAAQLYVRIPGTRAKQLRGFEKLTLQPGQKQQITFTLTRRDLSVWDTAAQKWYLQRGSYEIYIGRSSGKLPLKTYLTI